MEWGAQKIGKGFKNAVTAMNCGVNMNYCGKFGHPLESGRNIG
jgi:hypothetical protein